MVGSINKKEVMGRAYVLNLVINRTPMFEWYVIRRGSKNIYQKDMFLNRDWTTCSKYDDHFKLNDHHNEEDLYDHLMRTKKFTWIRDKTFIC